MESISKDSFGRRLRDLTSRRRTEFRLALLLLVILAMLSVWFLRDLIPDAKTSVGYPGILLLNFLAAFSFVVPIPAIAAVCGGGLLLNPVAVALVAGTGEALGELSGYALGYGGRSVVENRRVYTMVRRWMEKRGTLLLFLASVIPNPAFDLLGIAAGSLRFPLRRFLLAVWAGKVLKALLVAYGCLYSIDLISDFLRIDIN